MLYTEEKLIDEIPLPTSLAKFLIDVPTSQTSADSPEILRRPVEMRLRYKLAAHMYENDVC